MSEDAIVRLVVAVVTAIPALAPAVLDVLRPDLARSVRDQLADARKVMSSAPSPLPAVTALVERAKAAHPRVSDHHADVLARLAASDALTHEERRAASESAALIREIVAHEALPAVLDVPSNPFASEG